MQAPELYPPVRAATPDRWVGGEELTELAAPFRLLEDSAPYDASAPNHVANY